MKLLGLDKRAGDLITRIGTDAALIFIAKEAGRYKYLVHLFVFTFVIVWILLFITYIILVEGL